MFKKFLFAITFISIATAISIAGYLFFAKQRPALAQTANYHYISSGAIGNNDGSDWINAYTDLPATLVRGDTYYIADGNYGHHIFNDAESGSTYIYVKKATTSAHGIDTGWDNTYGDGQAIFQTANPGAWSYGEVFRIRKGYYVIDGVTGTGKDAASYGFKVKYTDGFDYVAAGRDERLIVKYSVAMGDPSVSYVELRHIELAFSGRTVNNGQWGFRVSTGSNWIIANNYLHNMTYFFNFNSVTDTILERNYIKDNWSSSIHHGALMTGIYNNNNTFRYNIVENATNGTGGFDIHKEACRYPFTGCPEQTESNWKIYGNIFFNGGGFAFGCGTSTPDCAPIIGWKIFNNTFVNRNARVYIPLNRSGVQSFNNLYYDATTSFFYPSGSSLGWGIEPYYLSARDPYESYSDWDYSYYSNPPNSNDIPTNYDAHKQNAGTTDPFVNRLGEDFRLTGATNPAMTLGDEFKYDMYGNVRGADGVWDRGAYEYIQTSPPLKGDFNTNGKVDIEDFTQFKSVFKGIFNALFDLNSDNTIDVKDLGVLMSGWLE